LKAKGINVNEESLRARSKSRKTIGQLEAGLDKKYKDEVGSDDDDESLVSDQEEQK